MRLTFHRWWVCQKIMESCVRGPARTMDPPRPYLWYLLQVIQTHFSIFIHFGGKYYINITTQSCFASEESRYRRYHGWRDQDQNKRWELKKILKTSKRNRREMTSIMLSSFFLILFLICSAVLFKKVEELCGGLLTIDNMHLKTPILNNPLSQS